MLRFLPICVVKKGFPLLSCISLTTAVVERFPTHLEAFVLFFIFNYLFVFFAHFPTECQEL